MLTAFPGSAIVQHGLAQDLQWLISKPWNDDALRLTLRHLLHDREANPPPDPVGKSESAGRSETRTLRTDERLISWFFARAAGVAARGAGWALGFFGATEAGGQLPH